MTARITDIEIDGIPVYVEVTPIEVSAPEGDAELAKFGRKARSDFRMENVGKVAGETVRRVHAELVEKLEGVAPDTLGLEFGLTVTGEGGFIFKAGASSDFRISVEWDLAERRKQGR
jgi:hypothetical protein